MPGPQHPVPNGPANKRICTMLTSKVFSASEHTQADAPRVADAAWAIAT